MEFEKIINRYHITREKKDKTQEEILEYEFYAILNKLLDILNAFEIGDRKVLKIIDQQELLGDLKYCYDWLKGNIKCLEDYRNTKK